MTPQKLVVLFASLTGGAIGLFAPIGVVKWLLQTDPEDAGILTLFFVPVWCEFSLTEAEANLRLWPKPWRP